MDDHRAGAGWSLGFDPADEAQQPRGVIRDAVIRPAGEVKLTDLPDLMSSSLETTNTHSTFKEDTASQWTDDQNIYIYIIQSKKLYKSLNIFKITF